MLSLKFGSGTRAEPDPQAKQAVCSIERVLNLHIFGLQQKFKMRNVRA